VAIDSFGMTKSPFTERTIDQNCAKGRVTEMSDRKKGLGDMPTRLWSIFVGFVLAAATNVTLR